MKKQAAVTLASVVGLFILILDSRTALTGAAQGMELCIKTVIPSLFPFLFLSQIITNTMKDIRFPGLSAICKLFCIPRSAEALLIPALLGGYPAGAQCVSSAYRSGQIRKEDAERLLAYCSNAGPSFLFGMLLTQFPNLGWLWKIWGIQLLSILAAARLFHPNLSCSTQDLVLNNKPRPAMETALQALGKICGWILFFRIVAAFCSRWFLWLLPQQWQTAFIGVLELANGCCILTKIVDLPLRFILCNCILSFGGLCVLYQTISVSDGLAIHFYILGKAVQAASALILSAALVYKLWALLLLWGFVFFLIPAILKKRVEFSGHMLYNNINLQGGLCHAVSEKDRKIL